MIKKALVVLIFMISFLNSRAYAASERIDYFHADLKVTKEAAVEVVEIIEYDFGVGLKHGIIREIPYVYENKEGKKFVIELKVESVTNEVGSPWKYQTSKSGENLKIKIGDPDKLISGKHTYRLTYTARGVITYFSAHDEIFWNVTGNQWSVPIIRADAVLNLPFDIPADGIQLACYAGAYGAPSQDCAKNIGEGNILSFSSNNPFDSFEGLSIVASFPKGFVQMVKPKQYVPFEESFFRKVIFGLLAILAFVYYSLAPFIALYLYFKYGRDPRVDKLIVTWYDPPKDKTGRKLTPAEVGTLVDETVHERDISATLIDLASRGYLKIIESESGKEYTFERRKEFLEDRTLRRHERLLLQGVFGKHTKNVSTLHLKRHFYLTAKKVMKKLYQDMVLMGYFPHDPSKVRQKYTVFAFIALFTLNIPLALVLFILRQVMPKKTLFGAKSRQFSLGLRQFLVSQERQLEFQEKNYYFFEKLLPYAIVFNVADVWAKRFEGISMKKPDWYEGSDDIFRTPNLFANSIVASTHAVESISSSPTTSTSGFSSGFSGGGFSGGGFGGGGGSSW